MAVVVNPGSRAGAPDRLWATTMATPVGTLRLVASDRGLRAVLWDGEDPRRVPMPAVLVKDHPSLVEAAGQLEEYFAGRRRAFTLAIDLVGTPFQRAAWAALADIPYGRTATYAEQAARLGDRHKARAVGAANGRNPLSIVLPCHRLVGSDGQLRGFAGGLDAKRTLLALEGATGL